MSSKVLTHCKAHCNEFLSESHFIINYGPGRPATLPDAFLNQDKVYSERGVEFIRNNPQDFNQVLKKDEIQESRFFYIKVVIISDLVDQIQRNLWHEKYFKEVLKKLERGESVPDDSLQPPAKLLLFKDGVVITINREF
ncbi:hypothetical protein O181_095500 [Austropuccinia psidii MF-1]|uniref:Uncharacterized protein n=1 Tax=Austropuccinia psidii MF-1 TaxID=1389203 RepID=A0A9Q3PC37_9BASI|nr:hypothetical protein [Austropuccinia psidii MF-1]